MKLLNPTRPSKYRPQGQAPRRLGPLAILAFFGVSVIALGACAPKIQYIRGTKIADTQANGRIIERVEAYRIALEKKDAGALLLMASHDYWEDSGSETGQDDYGFAGLKEVLSQRFQQAESIRYSLRYKRIRVKNVPGKGEGMRAFVDVLIDASFTVPDARGGLVRTDHRDQGQFVLDWVDGNWMFLSGM